MNPVDVKINNTWCKADKPVVDHMSELYTTMADACRKYDALKAAVQDMRDKQLLYFRNRNAYNLLDDAKAAERVVDGLLSGKANQVISEQKTMF